MSAHLNHVVELLNRGGEIHWNFASAMFVQVSLLIVVLLALDVSILRRLRASVRYSLWALVLVKLMLPVSLHSPVSVSRWMPEMRPQVETMTISQADPVPETAPAVTSEDPQVSLEPIRRSRASVHPLQPAMSPESVAENVDETPVPEIAASSPAPVHSRIPETKSSTGAAPVKTSLHSLNWSAYLFLGWIPAVLVLLVMFARRAWLVRSIVNISIAAPDELDSLLTECLQLTGVSPKRVSLRVSDALGSPAICGFWRGTILLPSALLQNLDRQQMRAILVHELVHWRRFDLQVNCLQALLLIVYFYNPLVWVANVILRRSREEAVDEAVLATLDAPAEDYSTTLLDIASLSRRPAELTLRMVGVVESRKALSSRIKRILSRPIPRSARLGITGIIAVLIAGLVLLPMAGSSEPQVNADTVAVNAVDGTTESEPAPVPSEKGSSKKSPTIAAEEKKPLTPEAAEKAEEAGIVLIGQLKDEKGNPATDAQLEVMPVSGGKSFKASTDEFGFYFINKIGQPGRYRLTIDSKRWVGISYRDEAEVTLIADAPNTRNYTLKRACSIRIRTVDEQGQPVRRVRLLANNLAAEDYIAPEAEFTDEDGWVTVGGLAPSNTEYLIAAWPANHAFEKLVITLDDPEQTPEKEIILRQGKTIKGTAICSDGKPPAGWRIVALPSWWHFGMYPSGTTISEDGSFTLSHIAPGKYDVSISVPRGEGGSSPKQVLKQSELFETKGSLELKMDHPSPYSLVYITGTVKIVGESKAQGFWIFADSKEPSYHSGFYLRDGNTEFKIGPVPKGTYELKVENVGMSAKPVTVNAPAEDVEIVVEAIGQPKLTGRVIDAATKAPVSRYRLRVYKLRTLSGPHYAQDPQWREIKHDGGNFEYEVHGPGVYKVQVAAEGYAWQFSDEINTVEDGDQPVLVALSEGISLRGTVVDEAGNPIDGAAVMPLSKAADVYSASSDRSVDGEGTVETVNGEFELTDLTPGEESLKVVHPDYCLTVLHHVAVGRERDGDPLRVTLNRGGTVRGRVFDADGNLEPNVTLHFHDQHGPRRGTGVGALATVVTDDNGFYEVQHLPEELCLVYRDQRTSASGVGLNSVLPANGQIRRLNFGGENRLTGRLMLNGTPLNDADLILSDDSPHSGIFRAFAQTQSDGSFTFRGVPPGERTLYYSIPGRRGEWGQARTIEVTRQNVDLGRIDHVTGRLEVRVAPITVAEDEQLEVRLQSYDPIWAWGYAIGVNSRNRENRSFTIDQIPPGKYELSCFRLNYPKFRKIVEITPDNLQQSMTVQVPTGTAVLSGRIDKSIGGTDYYTVLNLWSHDGRLSGVLIPDQDDGSYRMEHLPAGEYLVRKADTRDGHVIQTVSLQEGEQKTLDFTPDTIIPDPVTRGFLMVHSYSSGGIPLPCSPYLERPEGILTPQSSQRANYGFRGKPGPYTLVIEYPGFEPLRQQVEMVTVNHAGRPVEGYQINVFLNESK